MTQTHEPPPAEEIDRANRRAEYKPDSNGKAKSNGKLRFELIPVKDIRYDPKDDHWLVDGLLPMTGLAAVWGKYKSYKSFFTFDIAVAIADQQRKTWGDRALIHGPVVYVVAEDMHGFDARIEAYRREMAGFDELELYIDRPAPLAPSPATARRWFREQLDGSVPLAIFLDTLARMLNGEGENDTGMQNFVNNAEFVAEAFQCLAVAVHHESAATEANPAADKPRGHTSLPGALVASLHVIKTSEGIEGPWTADVVVIGAKNSATGFALKAGMKRIELGENRQGRMETVLMLDTVDWPTDAAAAVPKAKKRVSKALDLLMSCFFYVRDDERGTERRQVRGKDGPWVNTVRDDRIRDVFVQRHMVKSISAADDSTKEESATRTFRRQLRKAINEGVLCAEPSPSDQNRTFLWEHD